MGKDTLILGEGYLGGRLKEAWGCASSSQKIFSFKDAEAVVRAHQPKVLINCIGYNGEKNVDDCERNLEKTLLANIAIPTMLAELAMRYDFKLVQFSSGCIYHYDYKTQPPRTENDAPDYLDLAYSRSKIAMERVLVPLIPRLNALVVRIRMPLDDRPHAHNILTKLLQFKKVIAVPNSVTYVPDMIEALSFLIKADARGLYNVMNNGTLYFPELLDVCKKQGAGSDYEVVDFEKLAIKRTNIVHSVDKLEKSGFKMRDIREVYNECVQNYLASSSQVGLGS